MENKETGVKLTPDVVYGFTNSLLAKNFDNRTETPDFHLELWELMCSDETFVAVAAPRRHAKAQSLDSKVLTPTGWTTIGQLSVGDKVVDFSGQPVEVTHLHPISKMDLYEVQTRDGRKTLCNDEHLWTVQIPSNTGEKLVTKPLKDLIPMYIGSKKNESRVFIPTCAPIQFEAREENLEIDPYVLGIWLGDGHSEGGLIISADPEIFDHFPYNIPNNNKDKYRYRVEGLTTRLKKEGLLFNKHIPDQYFYTTVQNRLALLQGLMDSDGTVHQDGRIGYFCNTNKKLIDGVIDLVRSLGGKAVLNENQTTCNGKRFNSWRVSVKLPSNLNPFRLSRKADKWEYDGKTRSSIVSIKKVKEDQARCITVANPNGLYITDDYLVTHNSTAVTHAFTLANVCFRTASHIMIVSDTETQAAAFLGDIKAELLENEHLQALFGINPKLQREKETEIIIRFEDGHLCRILAKGSGQNMRGTKWRNKRPDLIVCDDLENDEIVMNEERRRKFKQWFLGALAPCRSKDGKIRVVGTILHLDSLLENFMPPLGDPTTVEDGLKQYSSVRRNWLSVRYKAHNEDFSLILWPEQWDREALEAERQNYIEQGFPEGYAQEYLNFPIDETNAYFRKTDIRPIKTDDKPEEYYVAADLAISQRDSAAYSVFVVVGMTAENKLRVRDVVRFRGDSLQIIDTLFNLEEQWKPEMIFIEQENIARTLGPILNKEMEARGKFLSIEQMTASQDKVKRARALQARMRAGGVEFDTEAQWFPELQTELLHFPRGKYMDQVDALAWTALGIDKMYDAPTRSELLNMEYEEEVESTSEFNYFGASAVTGY